MPPRPAKHWRSWFLWLAPPGISCCCVQLGWRVRKSLVHTDNRQEKARNLITRSGGGTCPSFRQHIQHHGKSLFPSVLNKDNFILHTNCIQYVLYTNNYGILFLLLVYKKSTYFIILGGSVISTVASKQESPGPSQVLSVWSFHVLLVLSFRRALWFPPTIKHMYIRVNTQYPWLRHCTLAAHCS